MQSGAIRGSRDEIPGPGDPYKCQTPSAFTHHPTVRFTGGVCNSIRDNKKGKRAAGKKKPKG